MLDGRPLNMTVNKIVCIGRNYTAHAAELNNPIPDTPLLFIKPNSTLSDFSGKVNIPYSLGLVHHELEIAILIGKYLTSHSSRHEIERGVLGVGLALDLTLRDIQHQLKKRGHPWERAKCFPGACPISEFASSDKIDDLNSLNIQLLKNNQLQQQGSSNQMIFPIIDLIQQVAEIFTLDPGDVILTGTPSGVSPLNHRDFLDAQLVTDQLLIRAQCEIIRN
ncbi:hypothetical protein AB835_14205 [Candidatus Endobugula sertula]|uniref:Fumarylacetoacetase-like C-terminal domain-containing protein n=1 Tax=Candidatus Endobugula sertula TaxID=62101 RepID=A0A1D2QLJ3_9GAMM|nr:hypothetical protein AB835_14205 [Candidatus Endobugula sertula]